MLAMIADAHLECKEYRKAEAIYKDALQLKKQAKPQKKSRCFLSFSLYFVRLHYFVCQRIVVKGVISCTYRCCHPRLNP